METNKMTSVPVIDVLIVDDHLLLREGLKFMLHSFKKELVTKVEEAVSGEKALDKAEHKKFDLVIVDYSLGTMQGDEFIRRLLRFQPETKVLALSNHNEHSFVEAMTEAGALGYVLKSILPEQMLQAIQTVLKGKNYYCNEIALALIMRARESTGAKKVAHFKLTTREVEVLLLIAEGLSNEQIAKKLFLARRTVDTHRQNLLRKIKVNNTAGLVRFAIELKLLK